jgi:hypothetical protein
MERFVITQHRKPTTYCELRFCKLLKAYINQVNRRHRQPMPPEDIFTLNDLVSNFNQDGSKPDHLQIRRSFILSDNHPPRDILVVERANDPEPPLAIIEFIEN